MKHTSHNGQLTGTFPKTQKAKWFGQSTQWKAFCLLPNQGLQVESNPCLPAWQVVQRLISVAAELHRHLCPLWVV